MRLHTLLLCNGVCEEKRQTERRKEREREGDRELESGREDESLETLEGYNDLSVRGVTLSHPLQLPHLFGLFVSGVLSRLQVLL